MEIGITAPPAQQILDREKKWAIYGLVNRTYDLPLARQTPKTLNHRLITDKVGRSWGTIQTPQ